MGWVETIFEWVELVGLLREYWGGFFPILLVEIIEGEEEAAAIEQRTVSFIFPSLLDQI